MTPSSSTTNTTPHHHQQQQQQPLPPQHHFTRTFMTTPPHHPTSKIPTPPLKTPLSSKQILQKMHCCLSDQQNMRNLLVEERHPWAAVAVILRESGNCLDDLRQQQRQQLQDPSTLEILLTKRVESTRDIFQGEVCLPGGWYQPDTDRSLFDTVTREVQEELGLDLRSTCRFIGQLPATNLLKFRLRDFSLGVVVYVFQYIKGNMTLGHDEVASAAWVNGACFWRGRQEMMREMQLPLHQVVTDEALRRNVEKWGDEMMVLAPNVVFSQVELVKGSQEEGVFQEREILVPAGKAAGGSAAIASTSTTRHTTTTHIYTPKQKDTWMIWGLTLEVIMSVFQYGASIPPLFPYSLRSRDPLINELIQFNMAFSKAFMESCWNVRRGSRIGAMICDGVVGEILKEKERLLKEGNLGEGRQQQQQQGEESDASSVGQEQQQQQQYRSKL